MTENNNNNNTNILALKGLNTFEEGIEMAYQILLRQLTIPLDTLQSKIQAIDAQNSTEPDKQPVNFYRIKLETGGDSDTIYITMVTGKTLKFSRNKFMNRKRIKSDLISHYKPGGYYVKPGCDGSVWSVDLYWNKAAPEQV